MIVFGFFPKLRPEGVTMEPNDRNDNDVGCSFNTFVGKLSQPMQLMAIYSKQV